MKKQKPSNAVLCVVVYRGKFLVLYKHASQRYSFPGGHQEEGETLQQTAIREFREEMGTTPKLVGYLGNLPSIRYPNSKSRVHLYLATVPDKTQLRIAEPEKHRDFRWISPENNEKFPISPNVQRLFARIKRTKTITLPNATSRVKPVEIKKVVRKKVRKRS